MKIETGLINKVLTDEQFENIISGKLNREDVKFNDTIRVYERENKEDILCLPFRISSKDVTTSGDELFVFNQEKEEYTTSYSTTKVMYAYGKEMRILLQLGEYAPVKVTVKETIYNNKPRLVAVCVQDQTSGLIEK